MEKIKKIARSLEDHIVRHRAPYAAGATILVMYYAIHKPAVTSWMNFLEEKGIDKLEYLNPEQLEEMNS